MNNTLVDNYLDTITFEFEDEQCQHSEHGKHRYHDEGPAVWWFETKCPKCGAIVKGYRCDKWAISIQQGGLVLCNAGCWGSYEIIGNATFVRLGE